MSVYNILIMTDTYVGWPGGSERHLYNYLSGLSCGHVKIDVQQMYPTGNPCINSLDIRSEECITLYSSPVSGVLSLPMLKLFFSLSISVYSRKYDLIVSYHEKSDVMNFLLKCLPFSNMVHISSKRDMGFNLSPRLLKVMKFVSKRIGITTSPSSSIAEQMVEGYQVEREQAHVIYNGVDLAKFQIAEEVAVTRCKRALGLNTSKKYFAILGTLSPVKGHKVLIEAFIKLSFLHDEWHLVIIGDGELRESLEGMIEKHNITKQVVIVGFQDNVSEWLRVVDVIISASYSEGLSNALVEAAASSLPIIATNVGGNPEVVIDQYNGLLIEPGNIEALSFAMQELAGSDSKRKEMGLNSRNRAESCFSNESMIKKLNALYIKSIEDNKKSG